MAERSASLATQAVTAPTYSVPEMRFVTWNCNEGFENDVERLRDLGFGYAILEEVPQQCGKACSAPTPTGSSAHLVIPRPATTSPSSWTFRHDQQTAR